MLGSPSSRAFQAAGRDGTRRLPFVNRFWSKVKRGPGCWEWQASLNGFGYGYFRDAAFSSILAHRVSWQMQNGDPGRFMVMHICDNPRCVRPSHLRLGTAADNAADMVAKNRQHSGPRDRNRNRRSSQGCV